MKHIINYASEDELTSPQRIGLKATTRAYEVAYQMITGEFWQDSAPPQLVINPKSKV